MCSRFGKDRGSRECYAINDECSKCHGTGHWRVMCQIWGESDYSSYEEERKPEKPPKGDKKKKGKVYHEVTYDQLPCQPDTSAQDLLFNSVTIEEESNSDESFIFQ